MARTRYPIRFSKLLRLFFGVFQIARARVLRSSTAIKSAGVEGMLLGLGVHGFAARWLVNGSLDGLVSLQLNPRQRAFVLGIPVELQLSLDDPQALMTALQTQEVPL